MNVYEKCEQRNIARVRVEAEAITLQNKLQGDDRPPDGFAIAVGLMLLVRAVCLVAEEIHFKATGGE